MTAAVVPLGAQQVTGVVRSGDGGLPLSGALVKLNTESGALHRGTLTGVDGGFTLPLDGPGVFWLRVEALGHVTAEQGPLQVDEQQRLELDFHLEPRPFVLAELEVATERTCRTLDASDASVVERFWDEATKSLTALTWTEAAGVLSYQAVRFVRSLDPDNLEVRSEEETPMQGTGRLPFRTPPPEELAASGYVQIDADGYRNYFGPDAGVLLSPSFTNTHCFAIELPGDRPDDVAIRFEPVGDRGVTDIEGVLWLSTSTLQLQQVEFRYTGLNLPVSDEHLGGQVEFSRLSTGAWAVTSWRIRMPNILRLGIWRPRLTGIREEGGEVVEIRSGGGEVLFRRDGGS